MSSGLAKAILLGTANGKSREEEVDRMRGGKTTLQRDQGCILASSTRAAENRTEVVANHLWCPNDPSKHGQMGPIWAESGHSA